MVNNSKVLINLRRLSQVIFLILFVLVVSRTMNHSFIEEERTSRLEEHNSTYYTQTNKGFPVFYVTAGLSIIFLAGIFIFLKRKNQKLKENKKVFSFFLVNLIVFLFSVLFIVFLQKDAWFYGSRGTPAIRIHITPLAGQILVYLFIIGALFSIATSLLKVFKIKNNNNFVKWTFRISLPLTIVLLLIIFGIQSYHPDPKYFTAGSENIPFFTFNKYIYNFDVPSTMFIETSALIGVTTSLASRIFTVSVVYIFFSLLIAFIFGRSFCGWVCPLGTLNHFVSWINQRFKKKKFPREPYRKNQRIKYVILIVVLISALFGASLAGFFDPFAILPRSTTVNALPGLRSIFEAKKKTQNNHNSTDSGVSTTQTPGTNSNVNQQQSGNSNSTGNNPYANSPDRHSARRGRVYGENEEVLAANNPYANAPDRNSYRNNTTTGENQNSEQTTSPYSDAPDRRSIRQQRTQRSSRSSESTLSFREKVMKFLQKIIFLKEKRHYKNFVFNGLLILIIFGLNFFRTRFWCRYICGLGALYGVIGKYSIMRIKQNDNCTNCKACAKFCQGACNPDIKDDFKSAECIYCFNCLEFCKFNALDISFAWHKPVEKEPKQLDIQKRTVIKGLGAGLATAFLFKTNFFSKRVNPKLVRPPGALAELDFLEKCIKCGNCMRICPNNFLQPTLFEAGLSGMFTPYGVARLGFCSPTCTLCGHACPTGAIRKLTEKDRGYTENRLPKMKIGTAHVNQHRCITFIYQRKCLVCEEHCPTSPKAIWKRDVKVKTEEGKIVTIGQPVVNPERCIGCGVCEHVCPVVDEPGIRITNVGETRNKLNDFSLSRQ